MTGLLFWKNWDPDSKRPYIFLLAILTLVLGIFLVAIFFGTGSPIEWLSLIRSETLDTVIDTVSRYPFSLSVEADSIIFMEYFGGSDILIRATAYYALLLLFGITLSYLMAVITYLPRFWYMLAMGLFVVVVISLKLDLLYLSESFPKVGIAIALVLFIIPSYYFQSFNKDAGMQRRAIVFLAASGLFAITVYIFSGELEPFMQLAVYSMPSMLLLAAAFILLVAHEIIASFLQATTSRTLVGQGNWKHFFVISIIYLLNVLVMYLYITGVIDWNILPINIFILLFISGILGIWGYMHRQDQYDYLFPFRPVGAVFYLCLATISFSLISFLYITGNDPILDVLTDLTVYAHLGYGFIFLTYIASNFMAPLTSNMQVFKVLYKPNVMPYFTYRLAGLLAFGALLFLENWELPVEKSFAGYYNSLGDLYYTKGEDVLATGYYRQGSEFAYSNHRSNYSLAVLAREQGDVREAIQRYNRSNFAWPTEYSYVNLSNIYFGQDRYFDALFALKEGLERFPDSGPIQNNLGVMYAQIEFYDSAFMYLERAYKDRTSRSEARNNILAIMARSGAVNELDQEEWLLTDNDPVNLTNKYALLSVQGKASDDGIPMISNKGNQFSHSAAYNYLVNNIFKGDTTELQGVEDYYGINLFFDRRLQLAEALNYYYAGEVSRALELMQGIRGGDRFWAGDIDQILGLWYFDNGSVEEANDYFMSARDNYQPNGQLSWAITETLLGNIETALNAWDSLSRSDDAGLRNMGGNIQSILMEDDPEKVKEWDDNRKYQWMLFRQQWDNEELYDSFSTDDFRAQLVLDKVGQILNRGVLEDALLHFGKLDQLNISQEGLITRIVNMQAELAARAADIELLAELLDVGQVQPDPSDSDHYRALLAVAREDSLQAEELFKRWLNKDPFKASFAVSASRFYESRGDRDTAYSIILNASSANPGSIYLAKEYVGICGRLGYDAFGAYILEELYGNIPDDEYLELKDQFFSDLDEWSDADF